jgi:hypothetical protein
MDLSVEPIERGTNIVSLSLAEIMISLTQAGIAEVETENREAESIQGLHRVEHNFVVHCAAI